MKKLLAMVLTIPLALGSMGVTAFGSVFADIGNVPWPAAAQFIDEAQSLGLMNGYDENGSKYCKPRNNVTLCESLQLIYSIMKVYTKSDVSTANITKWTPVMSAYNIPTWAYNATVYALETGIITSNDLSKLKSGTQNATREEVGVIFGKALATVYTVDTSATLSYADKAKISSTAVPYLALLNSKNIMVGDTENNFNPGAKINRAEIAVLSVKTYDMLNGSTTTTTPTAGTATGTVVNSMVLSNGDIFLSMKTSTGAGLNLFGEKATTKVTYQSETVELKDIGVGDTVTITYSGEDLKTVVISNSVAGINTQETYPLEDLTTSRITVKDGSSEKEYRLDSDVSVTIGDKKSSVSSLMDAMDDYEFDVTLTFDTSSYVTKIEAMYSDENPLTGDITYLSYSKITIKVGSKEYDYPLSEDEIDIDYDGQSVLFSTLLKEYSDNNYTVTLKLDSKGYVTDIDITFMEDETHGTLKFINSYRLQLSSGGETYDYDLDNSVTVKIDGKSSTVSSLMSKYEDTQYQIALEVDRYDMVTGIVATTKNSSLSDGTLVSLSSSKIKVSVSGKTYEYDLDSPTVTIDGKTVSFSTFKDGYDDYDYEFQVELDFNSDGDVDEIIAENTEATDGLLKNIEPSKDEITIRAVGVDYDYDIDEDVTVKIDGTSSTVSKLDAAFEDALDNDEEIEISLTLNSSNDVTKIEAELIGETVDTEEGVLSSLDDNDITIKTSSGTENFDFASSLSIRLDGSSSSIDDLQDELDDLASDEVIYVTLSLDSDDEVTKVVAEVMDEDDVDIAPLKGYLVSVSTSSGKIVIESGSNTYTWYTASGVDVTYDLSSSYDEDDYGDDLSGLKDFLNDCEDEGDDCYVTLTENSSGKLTDIEAEDK